MPDSLKKNLIRWAVTTISVWIATQSVSGLHADDAQSLVLAALTLGLLNAFLRPVLMLLSLPIMLLTLGMFTFVINAALLLLVGKIYSGFHVDNFTAAFLGGLVISVASTILNLFAGVSRLRGSVKVSGSVGTSNGPKPTDPKSLRGEGPVIDV